MVACVTDGIDSITVARIKQIIWKYRKVNGNNRYEGCDGRLLEDHRNEEILEELIVKAMRRRRLEWFGHVKRRDETENIRAVVEMKMEGKRPRGRPTLKLKDTVRVSERREM